MDIIYRDWILPHFEKEIVKEKPEVKFIKVNKSGEGLKTAYTVIPL